MADNENAVKETKLRWKGSKSCGSGGALYGLGVIGAAVYFLQHAASLWEGVVGIIKAFFWPSLILYRVLEMLKI